MFFNEISNSHLNTAHFIKRRAIVGKFIKKNSGFLYWVLVPSLLLVVSVFGVNFISRPTVGQAAPQCTLATDCNSQDPNSCRQYTCSTLGACIPSGIDLSQPGCGVCGEDSLCTNKNGICEDQEVSVCTSLGQDCGSPFLPSGCDVGCSGGTRDF